MSMTAALALLHEDASEASAAAPSRNEVLARYRRLREISKHHHSETMKFLSKDSLLHHARRLGLAVGNTLIADSMDELMLATDLAVHTAPKERSRAIDRYARSVRLTADSDEALVLEAMRGAQFSIISIKCRHETAGLMVEDLFRRRELWLVDEGMERSLPDGSMMATRLYTPDRFSMTAGVGVPFDADCLADVLEEVPQLGRKTMEDALDDRRFAEAMYRVAIADGLMAQVAFEDPACDAG
jgi:hypothetical protein